MRSYAFAPFLAALAASQAVHDVTVGGAAGLVYTPESITAAMGDTVKFTFLQTNHTATQSSFDTPCVAAEGGLDSDFMPNPDGVAGVEWSMTVDTTDPIWMYCKQKNGTHCGKGMVFAINPDNSPGSTKSFTIYKQLAIQQNGTDLSTAAIQATTSAAQASTVAVAATSAAAASIAVGTGVNAQGGACTCQCLCGTNSFPQAVAANNFGGIAGVIPAGSTANRLI